MSQIAIVVGHANPESFTCALAERYGQAVRAAGIEPRVLELAALRFDPVLRLGSREAQPIEPDLQEAQRALREAAHVAWFFPTWWAAPPALVKGFVDRALLPGFAYRYEPGRVLPRKLLGGRSARLVTTMDAPWWWYALFYRRALHASFVHATLRFVGFAPVATSTAYGLRASSPARRARLLERIAVAGARDARRVRTRAAKRLRTGLALPAPAAARGEGASAADV